MCRHPGRWGLFCLHHHQSKGLTLDLLSYSRSQLELDRRGHHLLLLSPLLLLLQQRQLQEEMPHPYGLELASTSSEITHLFHRISKFLLRRSSCPGPRLLLHRRSLRVPASLRQKLSAVLLLVHSSATASTTAPSTSKLLLLVSRSSTRTTTAATLP